MKLIAAALIMSASILSSVGAEEGPPLHDPHEEAMMGRNLNADQVSQLEAGVNARPDDLSARTKLLGYYFSKRFRSREAMENHRKHVLWVIRNRPEVAIAGLPYCQINAPIDPVGYAEGKKVWLEQTRDKKQNAVVLGNAAQFVFHEDPKLAEELFKQAQKVDPDNVQWSDRLGHLYSMKSDKDSAVNALKEYEKAQASDPDKMSRFYRLDALAKAALNADQIDKASRYANELLEVAAQFPDDWNYGNAIHDGNSVLGLVALQRGDRKMAVECLKKAGRTSGSPQLGSFGPNMSLAKGLLEAEERDAVLEYFELCRKFWQMGGDRLDRWSDEVKAGRVPDFGANLKY